VSIRILAGSKPSAARWAKIAQHLPTRSERSARARSPSGSGEDTYRRRLNAKLDDQLRESRREIDSIIEGLKAKTSELF
jgi:hypothetical protein